MTNRIISGSKVIRARSPGRLTEWFASADRAAFVSLPAATFVLDSQLIAAELAKRPFTVTRTVGAVYAGGDQVAADENFHGAVGFMVVSDKAAATGATALPDPLTEEASDEWFAYRSFGGESGIANGRPIMEFTIESRGQRKVADGETIVVMVSNGSAAIGCLYLVKFRMLVKLS